MTTTAHGVACGCVRCVGFARGNDVAIGHGAKAIVKLAPRAAEIAGELREVVPVRSAADDATIGVLWSRSTT